MDPVIEISDIRKTYGRGLRRGVVHALDGVSLAVQPGEIFGLLGPNGAGKTTLIKLLLGIARPTSGSLALWGTPPSRSESRSRVGYLPEQHRFPSSLTARQVLDIYGRLGGQDPAAVRRESGQLLDRLDLGSWTDVRVRRFSKGMMQRLGLAQALLGEPELVVLDEPTDGVDPGGRRLIRELVVWLRDQGRTVFLNSHMLSEVEQVCTRVAILHRGRLIREGTVSDLTASGSAWFVTTAPVPGPVAEAAGLHAGSDAGGGLVRHRVEAADRQALQPVLRILLDAGITIESVVPVRRTLEDSFLDLVDRPDDA